MQGTIRLDFFGLQASLKFFNHFCFLTNAHCDYSSIHSSASQAAILPVPSWKLRLVASTNGVEPQYLSSVH